MIGGADIVVPRVTREAIHDVVSGKWPEAVVEDAFSDAAPARLSEIDAEALPKEFFVYRDDAARRSWEELGATAANADAMIHVLIETRAVTIVVDGKQTREIADQLRLRSLKEETRNV